MKSIYFIFLLSYVLTETIILSPEDLIEFFDENRTKYDPDSEDCYVFQDPNINYINETEKEELYNLTKEAKNNTNLTFALVIVEKIDSKAYSGFTFADKLHLLMSEKKYLNESSIVLFFSISDRLVGVKIGSEAIKIFSASRCEKYVDEIKSLLRENEYFSAFKKLLSFFRDNYSPDDDSFLAIIIVLVFVAAMVGIFLIIIFCAKDGGSGSSSGDYNDHSASFNDNNIEIAGVDTNW